MAHDRERVSDVCSWMTLLKRRVLVAWDGKELQRQRIVTYVKVGGMICEAEMSRRQALSLLRKICEEKEVEANDQEAY